MNKSITFCIISCGELTEGKCREAIASFQHLVVIEEVKNVFPQINALNQMIEQCNTEWLIPLDADMILYENAWIRIQSAIKDHQNDSRWHSILFPLWDTLTERRILALKILRTSIMKDHLFLDTPTPDVEHYQRLGSQGFNCIHDYLKEDPIGDHIVKGKHFCYYKYRDVYHTYRAHNFEWDSGAFLGGFDLADKAKNHFDFFFMKWLKTNNEDYLHCIAGMVDGLITPLENSKTLAKKEYLISAQLAPGMFMEWYANNTKNEDRFIF